MKTIVVNFRNSAVTGAKIRERGLDVEDPNVSRKEGVERGRGDGKGLMEWPCQSGRFVQWARTPGSVRPEPVRSRG